MGDGLWETQVQVPALPDSDQKLEPGSSTSQMSLLIIGLLAILGWISRSYFFTKKIRKVLGLFRYRMETNVEPLRLFAKQNSCFPASPTW